MVTYLNAAYVLFNDAWFAVNGWIAVADGSVVAILDSLYYGG